LDVPPKTSGGLEMDFLSTTAPGPDRKALCRDTICVKHLVSILSMSSFSSSWVLSPGVLPVGQSPTLAPTYLEEVKVSQFWILYLPLPGLASPTAPIFSILVGQFKSFKS
jgi:hypothetical protein